jgi:hypothetical protein
LVGSTEPDHAEHSLVTTLSGIVKTTCGIPQGDKVSYWSYQL